MVAVDVCTVGKRLYESNIQEIAQSPIAFLIFSTIKGYQMLGCAEAWKGALVLG